MSMKKSLPEPRELLCQPTLGALQTVILATFVLWMLFPVWVVLALVGGWKAMRRFDWWRRYVDWLASVDRNAGLADMQQRPWAKRGWVALWVLGIAPFWLPVVLWGLFMTEP
jgi:hypothetical protein